MGFLHHPVSSWGCSFLGGSGSWDSIILHSQDESSQLVVSGTLGPAGLAALWNISCYHGPWVPFGHRRLLSLGLCSPPVLFLPALAAPCPAVQVPFTAAASVIVYRRFGAASASFCSHAAHSAASGAQCIAKLSCRHRRRCHSTAPASTARLHAHPVLYTADKKGQLFTASTAASRDMAAQDLVLGGPATWVRQPTYVARGYPHQSQETAHANEDWCLHQAQCCR